MPVWRIYSYSYSYPPIRSLAARALETNPKPLALSVLSRKNSITVHRHFKVMCVSQATALVRLTRYTQGLQRPPTSYIGHVWYALVLLRLSCPAHFALEAFAHTLS